MENRIFNISFISKEGNKVSLSINSSWLIYTANAADFKKAIKEYFMNDTDTNKINDYIDFMRECLETMQKSDKTNKSISAKLKALETVKTGKAAKKAAVSDFEKASKTILRNAAKICSNERTHTAYSDNGYIYITDIYIAIRTNDNSLYNGYVSENGLNMENIFALKNDICKVSLPDIVTVKKNTTKGKKETYFITEDKTAYNANYLYTAMLACSFDTNNMHCNAYKIENNNKSLLFVENTETKTNAILLPVFVRNESDKNVIAENPNTFIAYDSNKNVIGITYLMPGKFQEDVTKVTEDPKKQEVQEEKHNNVIEYIKKHFVSPVTLEDVKKNIEQSKQEDTNIYKIASVELSGKECRECINNKKYIVYKHCVYKVQEDTKKGYTAKRIYKSNDIMPLVNPGMYKALDRESVQRLIKDTLKGNYYA